MTERRIAMVAREDPDRAAVLRDEALQERAEYGKGHSGEYGTLIIHSNETGQSRVVYGNVGNRGIIANLPASSCVEVPCLVDRNGVQPTQIGTLPPQLAALMQTNINVQELTVEAALTGKREHVYQAAMLDPHTAAELSPDEIVAMIDELLEAHGDMIPPLA
jgi:alpha-galactosidase